MSISDFQVIEKLGEGSYSSVYKVQRKSDKHLYALKQVRFGPLSKKEKENALTEVRVLASISHPNIVAYKEAFMDESSSTLCLVMEFADDGDLLSKVQRHKKNKTRFAEQEIWKIFTQVSAGLQTLHNLNILHRDIKSANIFLTKDGTAKIGDLNVSKVAKSGLVYTQTGTPYYASPEVWKDQPYDLKSDVWSLGCVLYEAMCGHPPFLAADMKGLYKSIIRGDYSPLPSCYSPDLSMLISLLLTVNPIARPSLSRVLGHPAIQHHCVSVANAKNDEQLLKTIQFSRKKTFSLPPPKYIEQNIPESTPPVKDIRPKRRISKHQSMGYIPPCDPLKMYPDSKSAKRAAAPSRVSRLKLASPIGQDTIASRIQALKGQYYPKYGVTPRKLLKRRVSKPELRL